MATYSSILAWRIPGTEEPGRLQSMVLSRSGGEKGLRGSGAGTLGVPLGGTRRVGGLLGVAGRLSAEASQLLLVLITPRPSDQVLHSSASVPPT